MPTIKEFQKIAKTFFVLNIRLDTKIEIEMLIELRVRSTLRVIGYFRPGVTLKDTKKSVQPK